MAYYKMTTISGYDTAEPGPKGIENADAITVWGKEHRRCFVLRGHWKPGSAMRYGRSHGIQSDINIEHNVSDTSGHGRGGIDGRWRVEGTTVVQVPVSREEDEAYAETDMNDIWDLEETA